MFAIMYVTGDKDTMKNLKNENDSNQDNISPRRNVDTISFATNLLSTYFSLFFKFNFVYVSNFLHIARQVAGNGTPFENLDCN